MEWLRGVIPSADLVVFAAQAMMGSGWCVEGVKGEAFQQS